MPPATTRWKHAPVGNSPVHRHPRRPGAGDRIAYRRDYQYPIIEQARVTLFGDHKPANVVMGVAAMSPDYLIEVDAVAVVDG
jgi:hypothetical protein